jgi:hypothetical protein
MASNDWGNDPIQSNFVPGVPYGTPPQLLNNLNRIESSGRAAVVNPASGATGSFQFMPSTVKMLQNQGINFDPKDPVQSRSAADYYIQQLVQQNGGDYRKALANYGGFVHKDPTAYVNGALQGVQIPSQNAPGASPAAPQAQANTQVANVQPTAPRAPMQAQTPSNLVRNAIGAPQQEAAMANNIAHPTALQQGAASGMTFGFNDRLNAAITSAISGIHNGVSTGNWSPEPGQDYQTVLNNTRVQAQQAQQQHPVAYGAGQFLGGAMTGAALTRPAVAAAGMIPGLGGEGIAATVGRNAVGGMGVGAVSGGATAASQKGATVGSVAKGTAIGGGLGLAGGALGGAVDSWTNIPYVQTTGKALDNLANTPTKASAQAQLDYYNNLFTHHPDTAEQLIPTSNASNFPFTFDAKGNTNGVVQDASQLTPEELAEVRATSSRLATSINAKANSQATYANGQSTSEPAFTGNPNPSAAPSAQPTTPTITKRYDDNLASFTAPDGNGNLVPDTRAAVTFKPVGNNGVSIGDVTRGRQPVGSSGLMISKALQEGNMPSPDYMQFENITNPMTLQQLANGAHPADTVLGNSLTKAANDMGGNAYGFQMSTGRNGAPIMKANIDYKPVQEGVAPDPKSVNPPSAQPAPISDADALNQLSDPRVVPALQPGVQNPMTWTQAGAGALGSGAKFALNELGRGAAGYGIGLAANAVSPYLGATPSPELPIELAGAGALTGLGSGYTKFIKPNLSAMANREDLAGVSNLANTAVLGGLTGAQSAGEGQGPQQNQTVQTPDWGNDPLQSD